MSAGDSWLDEVILVNESHFEAIPGSVRVFRNSAEACAWLTTEWVSAQKGWALTASGRRLRFAVDVHGAVIVAAREPCTWGADFAALWLNHRSNAVLLERKRLARRSMAVLGSWELSGRLPDSTAALIAYVGFQASRNEPSDRAQ